MKLCIPEKILAQHVVALGKTGSGKSSALRHIVEHLLRLNKRSVIIDPKGDWWGLKKSADGKSAGFPVIAFGDFKESRATDIPINDRSGKHVAELIATGNRPCVIGFRGWMPGAMTRFWIDFASTLFNTNAGELHLFIDEVQNFAAKGKIMDPEAGKCLHWTNRLLAEGRGLGIVCLIASQRPQKVHNDTLTGCETLIALRVIHKSDRDALKDWIDGCGDGTPGNELLTKIASLPRGEAFVWSPEIKFGPERVVFPMFETFDSFAPPQLQRKVSDSGWADVDLGAVKEKLASVIEEAKANDPRELKTKISNLQGEIAKLISAAKIKEQIAPPVPEPVRIEIPVMGEVHVARLQALTETTATLGLHVKDLQTEILGALAKFKTFPLPASQSIEVPRPARHLVVKNFNTPAPERASVAASGTSLPKGERAILTACAQYTDGVTREQLTVLTGYKRSSRDTYLQRLTSNGFVDGSNGQLVATPEGIAALGNFEPLPVGSALRAHWIATLPEGERRVLEVLIKYFPAGVYRTVIDEATGYQRSSRDTYLQRLGARQLIKTTGRGSVAASDILFD